MTMTSDQGSIIYKFFFSDNKTLAQSIVDGFIKSLFNGIVVSAVALVFLNSIEDHLEAIEKRSALKKLRNDSIVESIDLFTQAYSKIACLRDPVQIERITTDCANKIDKFLELLQERDAYLSSIFVNQTFDEIDSTVSVIEKIQEFNNDPSASPKPEELVDDLSIAFRIMIGKTASNIK